MADRTHELMREEEYYNKATWVGKPCPPPQYDPRDVAFKPTDFIKRDCPRMKELEGITDSGERFTYASGALREPATGKGRPELCSPFAYMRLARWYEKGAEKYADRNWEKGIDFQRCTASMERHLQAWKMGKEDEDHLAAIAWNAFAIMHYQELGMTELDNMPYYDLEAAEEEKRAKAALLTNTPKTGLF